MTFQTTKNDPADRSEKGHLPLENELRSIWLSIAVSNLFANRSAPLVLLTKDDVQHERE